MPRSSLTWRLNATILVIVLIMTSGMVGFSSYHLYRSTIEDLKQKAEQTASLAQLSLVDRLWDFDVEGTTDIARSLLLDATLEVVSVRDKSGHIQILLREPGSEGITVEQELPADLFRVTRTIHRGPDQLGTLDLLVSTRLAQQRILSSTVNTVVASLLLTLLLMGSISFAADRLIKQPIFKLRRETDEVVRGNLLSPIDLTREDELGALARDFAHMRDAVREKIEIIEEQNHNLEEKVRDRTAQLEQKHKELEAVFSSLEEGLLTFSQTQSIDAQHSPYLLEIFDIASVEGLSLGALLFPDQSSDAAAQCLSALDAILGSSDLNFDFNRFLLPTDHVIVVKGQTRILDLSWSPVISDERVVEKMVLCVRDITEIRAVRALARANQETVKCLQELMNCEASTYNLFFEALPGRISTIREQIVLNSADSIRDAMRSLHTIKGNSRTFGFSALSDMTHEIEGVLKAELKGTPVLRQATSILERLSRLQEIYQQYQEVRYKVLRIAQGEIKVTFGDALDEVLRDLKGRDTPAAMELSRRLNAVFGQQDLRTVLESMAQTALPSIARDCSKPAPLFQVAGGSVYLTADRLTLLSDIFMHLFRNSLDHGIEAPPERDRQRKTTRGQIQVSIVIHGDLLEITYQDDGQGLDLARTRQVMNRRGLLQAEAVPSREELQEALFMDGFTTAERVTAVSGRGVGMSAVRGMLQQQGGTIHCEILKDGHLAEGAAALRWIVRLPVAVKTLKSVS